MKDIASDKYDEKMFAIGGFPLILVLVAAQKCISSDTGDRDS